MAAKSTEIAVAVADYLNSQSYGVNFNAGQVNLEFARQEQGGSPVAFVAPVDLAISDLTRGTWSTTHNVHIVLTQVMQQTTIAEQDSMMMLAEEIPFSLLGVPMAGARMLVINDQGPNALFEQEAWRTLNFFLATIPVSYYFER